MKPIKHRKLAYAIILLLMISAYVLYHYLRSVGVIPFEHDYITYGIGIFGIAAFYFVKLKGRI